MNVSVFSCAVYNQIIAMLENGEKHNSASLWLKAFADCLSTGDKSLHELGGEFLTEAIDFYEKTSKKKTAAANARWHKKPDAPAMQTDAHAMHLHAPAMQNDACALTCHANDAIQDKTRQDKTRQDKTRQDKTNGKEKVQKENFKPENFPDQLWADLLTCRKAQKAPLTASAWEQIEKEAAKAGISPEEAVREMLNRGWRGFRASWREEAKKKPLGRGLLECDRFGLEGPPEDFWK